MLERALDKSRQLSFILYNRTLSYRGVATNNGLGRARFKSGPFLYREYKRVIKVSMFLHRVNNIEHDIKQNIYTDIEVISSIPPLYCI